jgi:glutamate/tyrosine decarboxylase-like PLP-dependent enzyme
MMLKEIGSDKYGRLIQQHISQAAYLAGLVEATPELELLAPCASNIVCFRFRGPGDAGAGDPDHERRLNALNDALIMRLQADGIAVPSSTTLKGKLAIRVCCVNHRSRREDYDVLIRETVRLGRALAAQSQ